MIRRYTWIVTAGTEFTEKHSCYNVDRGCSWKRMCSSPSDNFHVSSRHWSYLKTKETAMFINKVCGCLHSLIWRLPQAAFFDGEPCCLESTKSDPFFEPFGRILVNIEKRFLGEKIELRAGRSLKGHARLIFAPIISYIISSNKPSLLFKALINKQSLKLS